MNSHLCHRFSLAQQDVLYFVDQVWKALAGLLIRKPEIFDPVKRQREFQRGLAHAKAGQMANVTLSGRVINEIPLSLLSKALAPYTWQLTSVLLRNRNCRSIPDALSLNKTCCTSQNKCVITRPADFTSWLVACSAQLCAKPHCERLLKPSCK